MHWKTALFIILLTLICFTQGFCVTLEDFGRLSVSQDIMVAEMLTDRVAYLPQGIIATPVKGDTLLVAGGWLNWPSKPQVAIFGADGMSYILPEVASPRFAVSSFTGEIAYWRSIEGGWARLAIWSPNSNTVRLIGEPVRIGASMYLSWLHDGNLVGLLDQPGHCQAYYWKLSDGQRTQLLGIHGGSWIDLRCHPGGMPLAVWGGEVKKCWQLGATVEMTLEVDIKTAATRPYAGSHIYTWFDAKGALWLSGRIGQQPRLLSNNAGAVTWIADGSAVFWIDPTGLQAAWLTPFSQQKLSGASLLALPDTIPSGAIISPDRTEITYWLQTGNTGQIRRAILGTEAVRIRTRFAHGVKITPGDRIWLAKSFKRDRKGQIKEPDWSTVKGEFVVVAVDETGEQPQITAQSIGAQTGILSRIAGRQMNVATPQTGGIVQVAVDKKLIPWLHGTRHIGLLQSAEVERHPLAKFQ